MSVVCCSPTGLPLSAGACWLRVSAPTIGTGASPACDGPVLVIDAVLGTAGDFKPKFVKRYVDLAPQIAQAAATYAQDVKARRFPAPENLYGVPKARS